MVKYETALDQQLFNPREPGQQQGRTLLRHRHVQLIVTHATLAGEMIAYEVRSARHEQALACA
jgi:hypothetical protein